MTQRRTPRRSAQAAVGSVQDVSKPVPPRPVRHGVPACLPLPPGLTCWPSGLRPRPSDSNGRCVHHFSHFEWARYQRRRDADAQRAPGESMGFPAARRPLQLSQLSSCPSTGGASLQIASQQAQARQVRHAHPFSQTAIQCYNATVLQCYLMLQSLQSLQCATSTVA